MPIKRLQQQVTAQMPLIGRLRKGAQKGSNKPGKDLDYFRFTSEHGDTGCESVFSKIYGAQPQSIKVMLPYPTIDGNFEAWLEMYKGKKLISRGDGETEVCWRDENDNFCTGERPMTVIEGQNGHRNAGRLQVVLPELAQAGYMGLVQVQTGSSADITTIYSRLLSYWEQSNGNLQGILFNLIRYQKAIRNPRDNKMYNKWLIDLIFDAEWARLRLESQRQQAYGLQAPSAPMLIDGDGVIVDEDEDDYFALESGEVVDEPEVADDDTLDMIEAIGSTLYQSHWVSVKPAFEAAAAKKHEGDADRSAFILKELSARQAKITDVDGLVEHIRKTIKVKADIVRGWITAVDPDGKRPSNEFIETLLGPNLPKGNDDTVIDWLNNVMVPF